MPVDSAIGKSKSKAWDIWISEGDPYLTQQLQMLAGALGFSMAARVAQVNRVDLARWARQMGIDGDP